MKTTYETILDVSCAFMGRIGRATWDRTVLLTLIYFILHVCYIHEPVLAAKEEIIIM